MLPALVDREGINGSGMLANSVITPEFGPSDDSRQLLGLSNREAGCVIRHDPSLMTLVNWCSI
jgi:hypothetical protein